jgi:DNA-binding CsgD family transcriptional regulator
MDHADLSSSITLIEPLTAREIDVLRLMAGDLTNQQMAERLVLSPTTVKSYTQQIYGKLGIYEPGQERGQAVVRGRPWDSWMWRRRVPGDPVTVCPCRLRRSSVGHRRSTPSPGCWPILMCGW